MKYPCITLAAGLLILVLVVAPPLHAQEGGDSPPPPSAGNAPLESLVLVLKIISSTHARPVTGIVLARPADSGPALVLVPAGFVSAGDEIIVLDGGSDILRHGRATRTVARSAEAGAALLEVDGLRRPGVELSAEPWPPAGDTDLEFAAWPPAEELAEGAPLIRQSVRLDRDGAGEPSLPRGSGPLFDGCGRLAALHIAGEAERVLGSAGLSEFIGAAGFEIVQAPCRAQSAGEAAPEEESITGEAAEPATTDISGPAEETGELAGEITDGPSKSLRGAEAETWGRYAWWLIPILLGIAGAALYFRMRRSPKGSRVLLEGRDSEGRKVGVECAIDPRSKRAVLEPAGIAVTFEIRNGRVLVSDRGDGGSGCVALAVDGTPCLAGEEFVVQDGREIRLGPDAFRVRLDLVPPDSEVKDG